MGTCAQTRAIEKRSVGSASVSPVETPADPLDSPIRLELSQLAVGYSQLLQLAWTKKIANSGFVKYILVKFDGHCLSVL